MLNLLFSTLLTKHFAFCLVLRNDLLLYEAVIKNEADTVRKVLKETVDVNSRNNVSRRNRDRIE